MLVSLFFTHIFKGVYLMQKTRVIESNKNMAMCEVDVRGQKPSRFAAWKVE